MIERTLQSGQIRVSASGLARIVIDDKYLLVLNKARLKSGKQVYTPFGGVIRFYDASCLNVLDMNFEKPAELRFSFNEQNLWSFYVWFSQRRGRETSVMRELCEELVFEEGVFRDLPLQAISENYIGTVTERAATDRPNASGKLTQRFYDVYDISFSRKYQEIILGYAENNSSIALLTEQNIRDGKSAHGTEIGTNSLALLKPCLSSEFYVSRAG
jgi:hypothetical protein